MIVDAALSELVTMFFQNRVIEINVQRQANLDNGGDCPILIDYMRAFSEPRLRLKLIDKWSEYLLKELGAKFNSRIVVVGAAPRGIIPAYALAQKLGCRFIGLREVIVNGSPHKFIDGIWAPGSPVLLVDDMVVTGESLIGASEYIRAEGGNIVGATSISNHNFKDANLIFERANIVLHHLFKITDIFDVAYNANMLGNKEMRTIMQWMSANDVHIT